MSALPTDLYQLTMMQAYLERGMTDQASFELFVRKLPPSRSFLLACGLEQAIEYLETLRFADAELDFLYRCGRFSREFVDQLAVLRFTGDVDAMPEGTAFFGEEPILRVTARLPQAQLVESRLVNIIHFQTMIASKAARIVLAAPGKLLVCFGLRRAHGAEAGLMAARASWLAGFGGTSNVLAGAKWGIPLYGTMAHSFVEVHESEKEAFRVFAQSHPGEVSLLLDTYDTEAAAHKVVELADQGMKVRAVRIDSGNYASHAHAVRAILDHAGLTDVRIFASGGLDEEAIERLVLARAPIDGFGVGTRLVVSSDAPSLDCVYKLVEYAGVPRYKLSEGKATWPGRKQVHRIGARRSLDVVARADEAFPDGKALLVPAMRTGRRIAALPTLDVARSHAARELAQLPVPLRRLHTRARYRVSVSAGLRALAREGFRKLPLAHTLAESELP
jgi:nicotinate phosphoribosyltransferase